MTGSFPTLLPSGSMSEGNGRNRVGRKQEVNEVMKFKVTKNLNLFWILILILCKTRCWTACEHGPRPHSWAQCRATWAGTPRSAAAEWVCVCAGCDVFFKKLGNTGIKVCPRKEKWSARMGMGVGGAYLQRLRFWIETWRVLQSLVGRSHNTLHTQRD